MVTILHQSALTDDDEVMAGIYIQLATMTHYVAGPSYDNVRRRNIPYDVVRVLLARDSYLRYRTMICGVVTLSYDIVRHRSTVLRRSTMLTIVDRILKISKYAFASYDGHTIVRRRRTGSKMVHDGQRCSKMSHDGPQFYHRSPSQTIAGSVGPRLHRRMKPASS